MTTVQQRYQPDSGEDEDKVLIPEQEPDYNKIENVADNYRIEEPISRNEQIDNRNLPPPLDSRHCDTIKYIQYAG